MKCLPTLFALSSLCACVGTETGNPSFSGTLKYNAYSSTPASVSLLSTNEDVLRVDATWLVLGDVDFVTSDECTLSLPSKVHAAGIGAGDHARPGAAQTPVELEAGDYCGVRLPLLRAGDQLGSAPIMLSGHSMLIEGTLSDGREFKLRSAMQADLLVKADDTSFTLSKDSPVVLIAFDVATWLGALDWTNATANADGVVEVDAKANVALLAAFETHVEQGVLLFRDDDADGEVSKSDVLLARGKP